MPTQSGFPDYCCELLSSLGSCTAKRMFGGWGISIDGLTVAILTDLGSGDKLWLKADEQTRGRFEAQGCERFTYAMRQGDATVSRSMGYYSAPEDAMESPHAMAPWARLALDSALRARATKKPAAPAPRKSRPRP